MGRNSFPYKLDYTRVQNLTTGATAVMTPNPMGPQTYGFQVTVLTNNVWLTVVDATSGGPAIASASQTVANPGVFTTATQAFTAGLPVTIQGTAPGGFSLNKVYYVIATGLTTTACELAATPGGTGIQCTASHACTLQPLSVATATNSLLVKATDFPEQYGCSPGQFISALQVSAGGTANIIELTH